MAYYLKVYQHALTQDNGGKFLDLNVRPDGMAGIPCDEFEKYGLQDEITVIQYCLPKEVRIVGFTQRFFKNRIDWFIGIKYSYDQSTGQSSWSPQFKISRGEALSLDGTGKPETANLHISAPEFNDKIRSMRIDLK
jgi:hypothetical protein